MFSTSPSTRVDVQRVVLVDGSYRVRNTLATVMKNFGRYEVVAQASDILGCLRAVLREAPDVVVFDLDLPCDDAIDAILAMRAILPDALIVAAAGDPSPARERLALAAGADACLDKSDGIRLPELLDDLLA